MFISVVQSDKLKNNALGSVTAFLSIRVTACDNMKSSLRTFMEFDFWGFPMKGND
jgi:hypothetical protein